MTERHGGRLVAGGSEATPGAGPRAGTEAIRKNLMSAGPVATPDQATPPGTGESPAGR